MIVNFTQSYFLRRAVKLFGNKIGVVDGPFRFKYREFDERISRLSNALIDMGIKPGDRVAIIESNSHYLLEALYGVMYIGAVLVTINARLFPSEILYILNDSGAKVLIVHEEYFPLIEGFKDHLKDQPDKDRWGRLAKTGNETVGVELRVLGEDGKEVLNNGQQIGEIVVRSNNVMLGYWNLPEEAKNSFTEDG